MAENPVILREEYLLTISMVDLALYNHVHTPEGLCVRDRSGECAAPKYRPKADPTLNQHTIMTALGNAAASMKPVVLVFPDVELVVTPRRPAAGVRGHEPRLVILDEASELPGQERAAGPCL